MNIGPYSIEDYMHLVRSFHGSIAPGLIIGGFMADLAMEDLSKGIVFDAVSETRSCLPDAIQLLTPCTVGNGRLKVLDLGRYALCLFDKYEGAGVRVFVDPVKIEEWPVIRDWFFKLRPGKEQDPNALRDQIIDAGPEILSRRQVVVERTFLGTQGMGVIAKCPACNEAYPVKDGPSCLACQGHGPYQITLQGQGSRTNLKTVHGGGFSRDGGPCGAG